MVEFTHSVMPGLTRHPEAWHNQGYRDFQGKRCHWMPGQARHDGVVGFVFGKNRHVSDVFDMA
jgi:hypothetical protein